MTRDLIDLLATDNRARDLGCGGLHPRLRAAIEADLRQPTIPPGSRPRLVWTNDARADAAPAPAQAQPQLRPDRT